MIFLRISLNCCGKTDGMLKHELIFLFFFSQLTIAYFKLTPMVFIKESMFVSVAKLIF